MAISGQAGAQSVINGHPGKAVAGPPGGGALDGDQAGARQQQAAQRCKESLHQRVGGAAAAGLGGNGQVVQVEGVGLLGESALGGIQAGRGIEAPGQGQQVGNDVLRIGVLTA